MRSSSAAFCAAACLTVRRRRERIIMHTVSTIQRPQQSHAMHCVTQSLLANPNSPCPFSYRLERKMEEIRKLRAYPECAMAVFMLSPVWLKFCCRARISVSSC
jgi:hypothetical protein